MQTKTVPFLDLASLHRRLAPEILETLKPLVESASFIGGDPVQQFEASFAAAFEAEHAVGLKSGTAALHTALSALGVGAGDEVIVPAFTFIATASVVPHLGAVPVFVDVDPRTAGMDTALAEAAMTPRTKAVIPVHLYGHPVNMDPLLEAARKRGVPVLEDCAQSHLATYRGRVTGTLGDAGAFSFYPTKNLGAAGDAGACLTQTADLAESIRSLANHGRETHLLHRRLGWNERLDAVQAAVLNVKLRHLRDWTEERRALAARYRELLEGAAPWGEPLRLPVEAEHSTHVYHLFVTRHGQRDRLSQALQDAGIGTAKHYPVAIPHQPAFGVSGSWPEAEAWADTCLALPLYPGLAAEDQVHIAETIRNL